MACRNNCRVHDHYSGVMSERIIAETLMTADARASGAIAWHRAGFRLFRHLRSRPMRLGRPKIDAKGSTSHPAGFSMNCPETNLWRTLEMNV